MLAKKGGMYRVHKKLAFAVCIVCVLLTSPVLGSVPLDSDPGAGAPKGAKQITPVLLSLIHI